MACMYITAENQSDPIIIRPRPLSEMMAKAVLEAVMTALNSNEGILVTDKFQIQLGIAQFERGTGHDRPIVHVEKDSKAIAVCLAHWEVANVETDVAKREARKAYNNIKKGDQNCRNSHQKKMALQYDALAVVPTDCPCSLANISKFEEALDIDVYVFAAQIYQRIMYPDYEKPRRERVYLFYTKHDEIEGHFDAITKVPRFLTKGYFCHKCLKGFHSRDKHFCQKFCRTCRRNSCSKGRATVCDDCNMQCRSKECFDHHRKCKTKRQSYILPRRAGMITTAGSLNADPAPSTTWGNTCAILGSGIRRTDHASTCFSTSSVPKKAESTCPTLWSHRPYADSVWTNLALPIL